MTGFEPNLKKSKFRLALAQKISAKAFLFNPNLRLKPEAIHKKGCLSTAFLFINNTGRTKPVSGFYCIGWMISMNVVFTVTSATNSLLRASKPR